MPTDPEKDRSPRRIQSVLTAFELLETLKSNSGLSGAELAAQTDISRPTVHTHLKTLESIGYVKQTGQIYDVGEQAIPLSEYVRNRSLLFKQGCDEIDKLAFDCDEYVHLMTAVDGLEIAVYASRGQNAIGTEYYRRMREEPQKLHYSSAGKAMLSAIPKDRVREIINQHGLETKTERTITTEEELFHHLEEVRERGFALNDEEEMKGMRAVGAPILGPDNDVLGAVSVSGPKARFGGELFTETLPSKVVQTANIIELNIKTAQTDR